MLNSDELLTLLRHFLERFDADAFHVNSMQMLSTDSFCVMVVEVPGNQGINVAKSKTCLFFATTFRLEIVFFVPCALGQFEP